MKQRTEEWIQNAEDDSTIARREMNSDESIWDGICFHAQQCAEKYLTAVREEENIDAPKVHDLVVLLDRIEDTVRELGLSRSELARLSTFGVATRYPGMDADPEASQEAMDPAASVRRAVREGLGSE